MRAARTFSPMSGRPEGKSYSTRSLAVGVSHRLGQTRTKVDERKGLLCAQKRPFASTTVHNPASMLFPNLPLGPPQKAGQLAFRSQPDVPFNPAPEASSLSLRSSENSDDGLIPSPITAAIADARRAAYHSDQHVE